MDAWDGPAVNRSVLVQGGQEIPIRLEYDDSGGAARVSLTVRPPPERVYLPAVGDVRGAPGRLTVK